MPAVRAMGFVARMERRVLCGEIAHANKRIFRTAPDSRGQSPRSPCPFLAVALAFLGRSCVRDLLTSSDSPNRPRAFRRTYRLSLPVSISSRFTPFRFHAAIIASNRRGPSNASAHEQARHRSNVTKASPTRPVLRRPDPRGQPTRYPMRVFVAASPEGMTVSLARLF
jgi:hypothetical protein